MLPEVLQFCPLEREHALAMLSWRYEAPYEMYSPAGTEANLFGEGKLEAAVKVLLKPGMYYFAVLDERDEMVAYRCYGADAQVRGGDYADDALDLGGGLRPELTGKGLGRHVMAAAMAHAVRRFRPRRFRVTVASFNVRARKMCERMGYVEASTFVRATDGLRFDVMVREAREPALEIPMVERDADPIDHNDIMPSGFQIGPGA